MRRIFCSKFVILLLLAFLVIDRPAVVCGGTDTPGFGSYVIVASEDTFGQPDWQQVIQTLREKYAGSVIIYRNNVNDVTEGLAEYMPRYTCFVEPAATANRDFVVNIQRLTRKLDTDAYTDTQWAILTGFIPEDALRIARYSEPLVVNKIFSGTVSIGLDNVLEGYQFNEGAAGIAKCKLVDGSVVDHLCPADSTRTIAEAWQDNVDAIYTSGHGSTTGWQIGYNYKDGFIRGADGQIYGYDATGKTFNFTSSNTKVYLPCGNCLIGNIPQQDCFATAMMHSGGVNQMFGYTVVTFYGYMGWGTNTYFGNMPGVYSLSEAFFANQQALLYELGEKFPALQQAEFANYEYQDIQQLAASNGFSDNNDAIGMLWDRDALAFYGDPAWRATVTPGELSWSHTLTQASNNSWHLKINTNKAGNWPDRPLVFFLPERINNTTITAGSDYKPVVSDNFILVPLKGAFEADANINIEFTTTTLLTKTTSSAAAPKYVGVAVADTYKETVKLAPKQYRKQLIKSLWTAGDNAQAIAKVLADVAPAHREAAAFLIANMPASDLKTLDSTLLIDNIELTYKAATIKQWPAIDKDIFLNYVLPYANLDEVRVNWRGKLMDLSIPLVADCQSRSEAAQKLNKELWTLVNVKYSTEREKANQNPFESMKSGLASCSGLSILLVDACRSVGIPARVAGIAKWPHKDGNHSWVEIWDGKWYTLGAWDGEGLDKVWFSGDAARARPGSRYYGIFAASYAKTKTSFFCVWSPENSEIPAIEVTDRYLNMWQPQTDGWLTAIRVFDSNSKRIAAEIKICQPGQCLISSTSRDETRDTNDTTTFNLEPGREYKIEVNCDGHKKTINYTPENKPFQTLDITL